MNDKKSIVTEVTEKLHRCKYKIIGTSTPSMKYVKDIKATTEVIEVDLRCPSCGKCICVHVPSKYQMQLFDIATNQKFFNIPKDFVYDAFEYHFDKM